MDRRDTDILYGGDNLAVLRRHIPDDSVDLIYLDPPFNSDRKYRLRATGSANQKQFDAFTDIWRWNEAAHQAFDETILAGGRVADALRALRQFLGENDLLAYLAMMAPRLDELHRVLKFTGTIYVHCDPTASHYLKLLMDAVFGAENMRNEIVWCYRGGGVPKKDFARKHDIILRYSKTDSYFFDVDAVRIPYSDDVLNSSPSRYDKSYRANKVYAGYRPNPEGKHPEDWWPIQAILPSSGERLGYPTQKPAALIERIIKASSKLRGVVLDPFCGSGTTLTVAAEFQRHWIGIDRSPVALSLAEQRLRDSAAAFVRREA